MARIIVTAGGTREKIDDVRSIHNQATGKLGSIIAEELSALGHEVTYIHGHDAVMPNAKMTTIAIEGVNDLLNVVERELETTKYDFFIHSMAVSDFYVSGNYTYDEIKNSLDESALKSKKDHKISSDGVVYLQMSPAPKVISIIKKKQAQIKLIGFKLLAGADDDHLIAAAVKQITQSQTDLVVANHIEEVFEDKHRALFITNQGVVAEVKTKNEIAQRIATIINKEVSLNE